ncbi:MAG: B12-binding domain-containing radical SAM protein [Theionarchaea archaeon]|nr:B12-binding domain-containing radical SAM protein [Theionarchaea archaeon]
MKILLVSPSPLNTGEWSIPYFDLRRNVPPLGVSVLKEIIKHENEVELLIYDHSVNNVQQILKKAADCDVTGFSIAHFFQYPATREIIGKLKQEEVDTRVILGGAFPVYHAQYLCEDGMDIIVNGEGEIAFPRLLEALETGEDLSSIQGLTYKEGNRIVNTGPAPLADLDKVPPPCYDDLPLVEAHYKYMSCETSRGCPNNCSFCGIFPHKSWRGYTAEKSLAAMERAFQYVKYARTPYIFLVDSNFAENIDRIRQMADLIDHEIPSYTPTRLDNVNGDTVKYFQKIGFKALCAGIESVSEETLASVNKGIKVSSVEKKFQLLIDHDIIPRATFILGLPGEDMNNVISTLTYVKHIIELFRENIHLVVFPCRLDIAATSADFLKYRFFESIADSLISTHDQEFRLWILALVYLVNVYHNTLEPGEQVSKLDILMKSPPRVVVELAETYEGDIPSWLLGFRRYFRARLLHSLNIL